jgi:hypothetical protein
MPAEQGNHVSVDDTCGQSWHCILLFRMSLLTLDPLLKISQNVAADVSQVVECCTFVPFSVYSCRYFTSPANRELVLAFINLLGHPSRHGIVGICMIASSPRRDCAGWEVSLHRLSSSLYLIRSEALSCFDRRCRVYCSPGFLWPLTNNSLLR